MTTPYAVSTNIGSLSYDNVNAPITGPLSTNGTPSQIPYHSYGTLVGLRPTPPQFYPMQMPVYASMNTNARHHYLRATALSRKQIPQQIALAKASTPMNYYSSSSSRQYAVSTHMNYIPPIASSLYNNILKSKAVGQTAYKVNLPLEAPISTKSYYPSGIRTTLSRVRSGGCTAPKKKGAIQNYSLSNGKTCAWGSIVRQNY
jgi:hypothetical protein